MIVKAHWRASWAAEPVFILVLMKNWILITFQWMLMKMGSQNSKINIIFISETKGDCIKCVIIYMFTSTPESLVNQLRSITNDIGFEYVPKPGCGIYM